LFAAVQDVENPGTEGFSVLTDGGDAMLLLATTADAQWNGVKVITEPSPKPDQKDRIIEALGAENDIPKVDEEPLARYYEYLSANLSFPFAAHYPKPMNSEEEDEFRCTVLELLDPAKHLGDGFDGIFCKTSKGKFEINLPLIELEVPDDTPNFQFIEDYWFWFWNWR
jgi:hypothetical protein